MRVEFKTDARNLRVRGALLGIGATFEGIFRKHMVLPDSVRDSAWYAILDDDWPAAKAMLEKKIEGARRLIVVTMTDLDELALALPQTTKELSDDGRPSYLVHGKLFCLPSRPPRGCDRSRRRANGSTTC